MVKVTISVEGTQEEVDKYLQKLSENKLEQQDYPVSWLPEEIERLIENITENAKKAFYAIAENPSREAVIAALEIDADSLPGIMSSPEFQRKHYFPSKPQPVEYDYETEEYIMLPEFIEWLKTNPIN